MVILIEHEYCVFHNIDNIFGLVSPVDIFLFYNHCLKHYLGIITIELQAEILDNYFNV